MMTTQIEPDTAGVRTSWTRTRISEARRYRRRPSVAVVLAALLLGAIVFAVFFPGVLATHDPVGTDASAILQAPGAKHWLGTDELGRDVYSRVVWGTRNSVGMGVSAILISVLFGTVLGSIAGIWRRSAGPPVQAVTDIGAAFPELILAILFVALFGSGLRNAVLAIGIAGIPYYTRIIRAQVVTVSSSRFVEEARFLAPNRAVVFVRHVLPNVFRPVIVLASMGVGAATLGGAALSFLGLGTPPPNPEWGTMLSDGRDFLTSAPWATVFPGAALTLFVIASTTLGRRIRGGIGEGRR